MPKRTAMARHMAQAHRHINTIVPSIQAMQECMHGQIMENRSYEER
jgi:hypothetical protein